MSELLLQHEHEDGETWSDSEPADEAPAEVDTAALQSREELRDGPTDITDVQQAWNTIVHCSIIVGMHPDQVFPHCAFNSYVELLYA